jgi:type IV pilus assembly protein PilX
MNKIPPRPRHHARRMAHAQRGVVMLFGLLALAIMLIGAAAMVRSMNTSMFNAGNLGFKRDISNQMERAISVVSDDLRTGTLSNEVTRQSNNVARNYRAQLLPSNAQGIPLALLTDTDFAAVASTANDITVPGQGITIRYVIDRLCVNTGVPDATQCTMATDPVANGGASGGGTGAERATAGGVGAVQQRVVYRLSVRVTGPRNTQAFFQSTMTML